MENRSHCRQPRSGGTPWTRSRGRHSCLPPVSPLRGLAYVGGSSTVALASPATTAQPLANGCEAFGFEISQQVVQDQHKRHPAHHRPANGTVASHQGYLLVAADSPSCCRWQSQSPFGPRSESRTRSPAPTTSIWSISEPGAPPTRSPGRGCSGSPFPARRCRARYHGPPTCARSAGPG